MLLVLVKIMANWFGEKMRQQFVEKFHGVVLKCQEL